MGSVPNSLRKWFSERNGAKRKLELLIGLSALAAGYLYVWVYQFFLGLTVKFIDFQSLLSIPLIALVVFPLVHYLWVKPDLLQRSTFTWKSVRFFQAQFPSNYIRDRCQDCVETPSTCGNFIDPGSADHTNYWLNDIWRGVIAKQYPDRFEETFRTGIHVQTRPRH